MTTVNVYRGDDVPVTITVSESINGVTAPLNLTGATLTSTIGGTPGWAGTPVVIDALTGVCEVQVPAVTMAAFTPGVYPMDIQIVKDGLKRTAAIWSLRVIADVTLT